MSKLAGVALCLFFFQTNAFAETKIDFGALISSSQEEQQQLHVAVLTWTPQADLLAGLDQEREGLRLREGSSETKIRLKHKVLKK